MSHRVRWEVALHVEKLSDMRNALWNVLVVTMVRIYRPYMRNKKYMQYIGEEASQYTSASW
jgi:hypothetical protein